MTKKIIWMNWPFKFQHLMMIYDKICAWLDTTKVVVPKLGVAFFSDLSLIFAFFLLNGQMF